MPPVHTVGGAISRHNPRPPVMDQYTYCRSCEGETVVCCGKSRLGCRQLNVGQMSIGGRVFGVGEERDNGVERGGRLISARQKCVMLRGGGGCRRGVVDVESCRVEELSVGGFGGRRWWEQT